MKLTTLFTVLVVATSMGAVGIANATTTAKKEPVMVKKEVKLTPVNTAKGKKVLVTKKVSVTKLKSMPAKKPIETKK